MRSIIIIFVTLVVLGGGFALYSWFQPTAAQKPTKTISMIGRQQRPQTTQSLGGIGGGNNPWIKVFERGELSRQFRGERYDPQQGDTVHVIKPQAEFFSNDGTQRVRIEGATGTVVVPMAPEENPGRMQGGAEFQPPSRGKLQDVVISMFEPADAAEPMLVARMNNAAFDNDTFRVVTESYQDDGGKTIDADQVPVVVRGRDYDFNGRGLVLRWNERDQKLQLLEIAHGESLTVKNPSLFGSLDATKVTPLPATAPSGPSASAAMLASIDRRAVALALPEKTPKKPVKPKPVTAKPATPVAAPPSSRPRIVRDASPTIYRATFEQDVRVFEKDEQIVAGDRINIDLLQEASPDATTQPASPTTTSSTKPAKRTRKHAATEAATSPATQPASGPIVIRWKGKLRVAPYAGRGASELAPGKAVVEIIGAPVVLTREGSETRCAIATFNSATSDASLRGSKEVPFVTMTDARGAKVTTPQLDYSQPSPGLRLATLIGAGSAELPIIEEGRDPQQMKATWSKDCRLRMGDAGPGKMAIERADLAGDVRVNHPQMELASDALALRFDPASAAANGATTKPTDSAPPRDILASGNVKCRIIDPEHEQNITAQQVHVGMGTSSTGQTYAKLLEADGDVRTIENGRQMKAGHLVAEMAPATQPTQTTQPVQANAKLDGLTGGRNLQLVSLVARDNVELETEDGTRASADELRVINSAGRAEYRLIGKPLATVTDGKTNLSGPEIRFSPDDQIAQIIGPGTLHGMQPENPKQAVDIAWAQGATVNGAANWIDVAEKVKVTTVDADGAINTATADRLRATLAPVATTATAPAKPSTRSANDKMNFMAGKEITETILYGHVEVKSELLAPDGAVLRGLNLRSEAVRYNRATGRMEVPAAGEMLYRDLRAPEKPADAAPEGPTIGSGRGSTAFKWNKWLVYDQAARQAVMKGNVEVVHWPEENAGQPFHMWSDTLTAHLEPDPDGKNEKFRLKSVVAHGDVKVTSQRLNLDANDLTYDPLAQLLTATADPTTPITFFDAQTASTTTAAEVQWNTKTDQVRVKALSGNLRR